MQTGITLADVILSLTFFALLWYAWETRGMHKEIVDQTRLQLTPFVVVALEGDGVMAVNHGESTATNIEFRCSSPTKEVPIPLPIGALSKGEKKYLQIKVGGSEFETFLLCDIEGAKKVNFQLGYSNIFGRKYQTKGILTGEGLSVTEFRNL